MAYLYPMNQRMTVAGMWTGLWKRAHPSRAGIIDPQKWSNAAAADKLLAIFRGDIAETRKFMVYCVLYHEPPPKLWGVLNLAAKYRKYVKENPDDPLTEPGRPASVHTTKKSSMVAPKHIKRTKILILKGADK